MSKHLSPGYWEQRYQQEDTPWDIGYSSPPLLHYLEKLSDYSTRILIPGAGHAYEAVWLHRQGFKNVYVCDWAPSAFERLQNQAPGFPKNHQLAVDFFTLDRTVDLILEQTFFCALPPEQRPDYVKKTAQLLSEEGRVAGLLFAHPFDHAGPPFGGTAEEYRKLFQAQFDILQMQLAPDSIAPRAGRELFFEMKLR